VSVTGQRLTFGAPLNLLPGTLIALEQPAAAQQTAVVLRHVVNADPAGTWIEVDAPLAGVNAAEQPPIDVSLPLLLSTGAVAAQTNLVADDGNVAATVVAASPGSWGNTLAVRIQRQTVAQTVASGAPLFGGQQIPVSSVARFSRGTFVRVRQGSVPDAYHVVCDIDPVNRTLVVASDDPGRSISPSLNVPLSGAFSFAPGAPPVSIEALALDVVVLLNGAAVETYPSCSPLDVNGWNAQLSANASRITIVPSSVPTPSLDPTTWAADVDAQYLWGGTDGTRMLGTSDLLTALATLAPISEPTLIAIPDACAPASVGTMTPPPAPVPAPSCTDQRWLCPASGGTTSSVPALPPQPVEGGPGFDEDDSAIVAQGLVAFCDSGVIPNSPYPPHPSFRFALVDVPNGTDPVGFRQLFDATRAAIHWPWAGVYDPLGAPGTIRLVPSSGHVAGAFAGMDLAVGAFRSAANTQLEWIASLASEVDAATAAVYNDAQVNCIRALPNRGLRIFGARTLSSDPTWLFIPVRRLVSMIESAILSSMQWAVFEPNNATLRGLVRRACTTFLQTLWEKGAFAGTSAAQAFTVVCDGSNNPVSSQANGQLFVDIAVAPVRPAEYIVFRVGQQQGVLEVFEGAAA